MTVNVCAKCLRPIPDGNAYCNKCKPSTNQTVVKPTVDGKIILKDEPIPKNNLIGAINKKWERMVGPIPQKYRDNLLKLGYKPYLNWELDGMIVRCPDCSALKTVHTLKQVKCSNCGRQFQVAPKRTHMDEIIMAIPTGKLPLLHEIMRYSRR